MLFPTEGGAKSEITICGRDLKPNLEVLKLFSSKFIVFKMFFLNTINLELKLCFKLGQYKVLYQIKKYQFVLLKYFKN